MIVKFRNYFLATIKVVIKKINATFNNINPLIVINVYHASTADIKQKGCDNMDGP